MSDIKSKPPEFIEIGYSHLNDVADGDSHFECHISTLGLKASFAFFTVEESSKYFRGPYFTLWDRFDPPREHDPFEIGYAMVEFKDSEPVVHIHLDSPTLAQPFHAFMIPKSSQKDKLPEHLKDDPSRLKHWKYWQIIWKR